MIVPWIDLPVLGLLIILGLVGSAAYYVVMLYGIYDFSHRYQREPQLHDDPPVTVLKPLKGTEPYLYENLASLCEQDYERFQIVCGVADGRDPAIAVVRRLQKDYPNVDIGLVIDARVYGSNYKVSNLQNMYRQAKHDVLVIADSDIRVKADYLTTMVAQVVKPRTGIVTCLYRAMNTGGLPSLFESLFINADFCGMVLVARKVERSTYAFGATIALRREVLDQIGGFLPLANFLADDYQLGYRVAGLGYELVLSDHIVDTVVAVDSWRTLLQRQLRWARTYRACRPVGYFNTILTHGSMWALVHLVYNNFSAASWLAAGTVLGLRYCCAALLCGPFLRANTRPHQLALIWAKDLLVSMIWFCAFAKDTVWWSGHRFRISSNGEMTDLTPGAPAAESWQPEPISAVSDRDQ